MSADSGSAVKELPVAGRSLNPPIPQTASFTLDDISTMFQRHLQPFKAEIAELRAQREPAAYHEDDEKRSDIARQRHAVHTSRQSVSNIVSESVNIAFGQSLDTPSSTPFRPQPPRQSTAAFNRRLSQGIVDDDPPVSIKSVPVANMDKEQLNRYNVATKQVTNSVAKFHGIPAKDNDRTPQEFVQLINSEMDTWMGSEQQHGRLNLVIGRTDGIAQNWLARKREEMQRLLAARSVTEVLLTEWMEIQGDFIKEMSKGITSAMYEQQLRALKLRDSEGNSDPTSFIRRFDDICARLYPINSWTNYHDRSRRLAEKFEERVKYGGANDLWESTWLILVARGVPEDERTVEDWQDALLQAWNYRAHITRGGGQDSQHRGRGGGQGGGAQRGRGAGAASPPAAAVNAMSDGGDSTTGEEHTKEGEVNPQLSAAGSFRGGRGRGGGGRGRGGERQPMSAERQTLYNERRCFRCKEVGHTVAGCPKPPNPQQQPKEKAPQ